VLGRFLFRWRGVIGVAAFGVLFWLARPTFGSCFAGVPLLLAGLAVRFWASGYIGIEGRAREIGASRRIVSGPYRLLRHPLYVGNFLLVAGMLVALRPALWLGAVVMAGFVVEYAVIMVEEERYLSARRTQRLEARSQSAEVQCGEERLAKDEGREADGGQADRRSQKPEARSQSAEVQCGEERPAKGEGREADGGQADRRSQKPEARMQNAELRMAVSGRREAEGGSFSARRALCEWRTWVATGVAFGLAVARALIGQ
jgi:uncharacterized low-complexity protein